MKIFTYIFITGLLSFLVTGCGSSNNSFVKSEEQIDIFEGVNNPDPAIDLAEHLKRVPGVTVRGSGRNATVTIHGINSLSGSNEPLFVVNGLIIDGGYNAVASMISVHDIKSIKVLKDASDMTFYGVRGANGVIQIKLKN